MPTKDSEAELASDALAQLRDAATLGTAPDQIDARCECGYDADGTMVVVDRWLREYPPIPYTQIHVVQSSEYDEETGTHPECPACGEAIDADTVLAR